MKSVIFIEIYNRGMLQFKKKNYGFKRILRINGFILTLMTTRFRLDSTLKCVFTSFRWAVLILMIFILFCLSVKSFKDVCMSQASCDMSKITNITDALIDQMLNDTTNDEIQKSLSIPLGT
jgi:hypothetical protein